MVEVRPRSDEVFAEHVFRQQPCSGGCAMKRIIKSAVTILCTVLVLPAIVLYRLQMQMGLGKRCFPGWSQLFSLLPGGLVCISETRSIELPWIDVLKASGSDSARCSTARNLPREIRLSGELLFHRGSYDRGRCPDRIARLHHEWYPPAWKRTAGLSDSRTTREL